MPAFDDIVPSAAGGGERGVRVAAVGEGDGGRGPRLGLVARGHCGCVLDPAFDRCLLLYLQPTGLLNSTLLPLYALCCW